MPRAKGFCRLDRLPLATNRDIVRKVPSIYFYIFSLTSRQPDDTILKTYSIQGKNVKSSQKISMAFLTAICPKSLSFMLSCGLQLGHVCPSTASRALHSPLNRWGFSCLTPNFGATTRLTSRHLLDKHCWAEYSDSGLLRRSLSYLSLSTQSLTFIHVPAEELACVFWLRVDSLADEMDSESGSSSTNPPAQSHKFKLPSWLKKQSSTYRKTNNAPRGASAIQIDVPQRARAVQEQPKPSAKSETGLISTTVESLCPISELWNQAFDELKQTDEVLIKDYQNALLGDLATGIGSMVIFSGLKFRDKKKWEVCMSTLSCHFNCTLSWATWSTSFNDWFHGRKFRAIEVLTVDWLITLGLQKRLWRWKMTHGNWNLAARAKVFQSKISQSPLSVSSSMYSLVFSILSKRRHVAHRRFFSLSSYALYLRVITHFRFYFLWSLVSQDILPWAARLSYDPTLASVPLTLFCLGCFGVSKEF